jgi:hypothetical protein
VFERIIGILLRNKKLLKFVFGIFNLLLTFRFGSAIRFNLLLNGAQRQFDCSKRKQNYQHVQVFFEVLVSERAAPPLFLLLISDGTLAANANLALRALLDGLKGRAAWT